MYMEGDIWHIQIIHIVHSSTMAFPPGCVGSIEFVPVIYVARNVVTTVVRAVPVRVVQHSSYTALYGVPGIGVLHYCHMYDR